MSARAKRLGDGWESTLASCRGSPCVPAQFCAASAFGLGFEGASLRKNRRPQRRRSALRLLVIIPVARAARSLRLVAASNRRARETEGGSRDFGGPAFRDLLFACPQECPGVVGSPG